MNIYYMFLLFWIFSIFGWFLEEIAFLVCDRKIVNRGFLIGPYCPIYGVGGIAMSFFLPFSSNNLLCFILSLIVCSIIEYIVSYIMEKMFDVRWWDYSNYKFNINGRICLRNALAFGVLGMVLVNFIYPFSFRVLDGFDLKMIKIIDLIILIITLIDIVLSFKVMKSIKNVLSKNLKGKRDATDDIKKIISNKLSINYLNRRVTDAYRHFSYQTSKMKKRLYSSKNYLSNMINSYYVIGGFLTGIICSILFDNFVLYMSIGILGGFIIDIFVERFNNHD